MALGRMSSLARLLACPGYQTVPTDGRAFSANSEDSRNWGTAIHLAKEGVPITDAGLLGARIEGEGQWLSLLASLYTGWKHEVHVSYDVSTHVASTYATDGEKVDCCLDEPTVLTGCVDAQLIDSDGDRVLVNDLKTGEDPVDLDDPQLMGYLLTVLTLAIQGGEVTKQATCALSVLHYPRKGWWRKKYLEEDGVPWRWNARDVPLDEIRAFRASLVDLLPKARRGLLQASDECVFCPAHAACPLWAARTPSLQPAATEE